MQTIDELVRRHTTEAARASFTLSSPVPPFGLSLQCVQLEEAQRRIDAAIREAFHAGVAQGLSRATRPVVEVPAHDDTRRLPPVRGPYPPTFAGPRQITRER